MPSAFARISVNAVDGSPDLTKLFLSVRPLEVDLGIEKVKIACTVRKVTDPCATVGVYAAGAITYFSGRSAVDFLGKSDAVIAHEPAKAPTAFLQYYGFLPGHLKHDYAYSFGKLRPDIVGEYVLYPEEAKPYLSQGYRRVWVGEQGFYCLTNSPHIRWEKILASSTPP